MKPRKVGSVAPNKIPIFDHRGNLRGAVGHKATSVTVSRFTGTPGAKLGRKGNRQAWLGAAPLADAGAPAQQPETANHKAARGSVKAK
jgi:hypothetical protein